MLVLAKTFCCGAYLTSGSVCGESHNLVSKVRNQLRRLFLFAMLFVFCRSGFHIDRLKHAAYSPSVFV